MIVVFEKSYPLRHIGHLDLMRTMQRALRRSGLPVCYSHGFNPHIQISFAAPLSVGIIGEREIMDVPLEGECSESAFIAAIHRVIPICLPVVSARAVDDAFPTLMGLMAGSRYRIEMGTNSDMLAGAVKQLLSTDEYVALRKTKSGENMCDIRPYIHTLNIKKSTLFFIALNLQSGSLKPSLVLNILFALANTTPCEYTTYREAILAKDAQGSLVPLEVIQVE